MIEQDALVSSFKRAAGGYSHKNYAGPLPGQDRLCKCPNKMPCGHWGEADGLHKCMNDHCFICGKYYKLPAIGITKQDEPRM